MIPYRTLPINSKVVSLIRVIAVPMMAIKSNVRMINRLPYLAESGPPITVPNTAPNNANELTKLSSNVSLLSLQYYIYSACFNNVLKMVMKYPTKKKLMISEISRVIYYPLDLKMRSS